MEKGYFTMKSNLKLLFITILFLLIGISAVNAQTEGDYKSVQSGNWSTLTIWVRWDSSSLSWKTPTLVQGYPGQYSNVDGTVTIQSGNTVTLDVNLPFDPISSPYISTLVINGEMNFDSNKTLNVLEVDLFGGKIVWPQKAILALSANSIVFMDDSGGLVAEPCDATQRLNLGIQGYAACKGYGKPQDIDHNSFLFEEVNTMNGSFYPIITSDAPVCSGSVINLNGTNSKGNDVNVTYYWSIKDTSNNLMTITNPTSKNISVSLPVGIYAVTLKVTYEYKQNKYYPNSKTIFIEVLNCENWVGSADNVVSGYNRGTDWAIDTNWKSKKVPDKNANIGFDPLALNHLQLDADHEINNLVNKTTKNLIIPPTKTLTANGILNTGSNPDKIQIQAAANAVNGSLILTDSISYFNSHSYKNKTVYATVQMYSKAFLPSGNTRYKWQYLGIPVKVITNQNTAFAGVYKIRSWDEPTYSWVEVSDFTMLTPFDGFEIAQNTGLLYTIQGQLVTESKSILDLSKKSASNDDGYHLFANPYTAAIPLSSETDNLTMGGGMDNIVYLFNTGSHQDWVDMGGLNQQNMTNQAATPGQYVAVPLYTGGQGIPALPSEIPSMQGFFVRVNNTDKANISFTYPGKKNTKPLLVKRSTEVNSLPYITLTVNGTDGSDIVWVFSEETTTPNFDCGWDGYKWEGSVGLPQMFVSSDAGNLQVCTSNDITNTYVAFKAGNGDGNYTLTINIRDMDINYPDLILIDLKLNKTITLNQPLITYNFTADNTSAAENRFLLTEKRNRKRIITVNQESRNAFLTIYSVDKTIRIQNSGNENGTVQLFDFTGKQIYTGIYQANTTTEIKTGLQPGVYLVNVKSAGMNQHKKVLIRP